MAVSARGTKIGESWWSDPTHIPVVVRRWPYAKRHSLWGRTTVAAGVACITDVCVFRGYRVEERGVGRGAVALVLLCSPEL